ncbi:cobaltochelatase subunit CobN [Prochlorococcus sp. MIT 1300]|uniref:cobaltochelatase subunit CobN n=1 Tax=Prochlorococcus sp. MIT 1300 TaxID=3096218 RepID=UPI002A7555C1|nr:cobaltochelatase subunit CobN [Prochlorococcus sp. MIT 1300]
MHRIASLPGDEDSNDVTLVEQPPAPVLFLTSAVSDISTLATAIDSEFDCSLRNEIRALPLSCLSHPSQIDHYLTITASKADVIILRLLGGREHWSYGIEQLLNWQEQEKCRELILLAGTQDQFEILHHLGTVNYKLANHLAELLIQGGTNNIQTFLQMIQLIKNHRTVNLKDHKIDYLDDPYKWNWQDESGPRVGLVVYRSLVQSGDTKLINSIIQKIRLRNLVPRTILVSSLRSKVIQQATEKIFKDESVSLVLTLTSFASVIFEEASLGAPLWDSLDVPVLQALISTRSKKEWSTNDRGLDPLDLSLQVVLPELDGRITTRPAAFRSVRKSSQILSTILHEHTPNQSGIQWIVDHVYNWVELQRTQNNDKKVAIVLSNYPIRNGRLANGVGLDTPESLFSIINWLKDGGYNLSKQKLPVSSKELIDSILKGRTNDPESFSRAPLTYLSLNDYLNWWSKLPKPAKLPILKRWGEPQKAIDLESSGFAIHGIQFGNIVILIQPSRGYDSDQLEDLHSPYLPPPHRYLAQYVWAQEIHNTQALIHLGKHGSVEWLPGKAVGLSINCYPNVAINAIPVIYPFIVNDPGEGSQAKRRKQAVIIDHLTPPLDRAELSGDYLVLENLIDEYFEAEQLQASRLPIIQESILKLLNKKSWPIDNSISKIDDFKDYINQAESYICELKEAQIRTGLHSFGQDLYPSKKLQLLLTIVRSPFAEYKGFTQSVSERLELSLDPWCDEEGDMLNPEDILKLRQYCQQSLRRKGDAIDWIEHQALHILSLLVELDQPNFKEQELVPPLYEWVLSWHNDPLLKYIKEVVYQNICNSFQFEKKSLLNSLNGRRVKAGPSGAPTRSRHDVLPTGRNFFSVDLRGLPTESAWDLGRRNAETIIENYILKHGEYLKSLALSVWGTSTMRNGGEDIALLLALIGVKPIWDGPSRRMVDLEVIPIKILQRPRVDVTLRISGLFRDAFPQLIGWVHKAVTLVGKLDEEQNMNPYSHSIKSQSHKGRIYGSAPGSYGAGLQGLIDNGQWNTRSDLGEVFMEWSKWSYDDSANPKEDRKGLEEALEGTQIALHTQDNREHDLLDSDDYYQFHGGLSAAIEKITGSRPEMLFADNSRKERPRVHSLTKEIDKVVRSRLTNPKWIKGMIGHGYKGGFEMSASLDYLFAYDASTGCVPNWCYSEITSSWLDNKEVITFLKDNNPWSLRDISERLLEASHRGLWEDATKEQIQKIKGIVIDSESIIEQFD